MQEEVAGKGIVYVWHFTRLTNLGGILRNGLITRQSLVENGVPSEFNDEYRLDGCEDSICCSIGHPNYKMFYRLRQENPGIEWVVIALKSSLLWEKDCAFCITNAASNVVTCVPLQERRGVEAFNRMFDEVPGKPLRADLGISEGCPTDPQAEVLVFEYIEPEYIAGVITQRKQTEILLKPEYPGFEVEYHRAFFSPRKDYQHW